MIQRINLILLGLLLALLPWHGFLTTFMPEGFRFWKEGVLGLLFLLSLPNLIGQSRNFKTWIQNLRSRMTTTFFLLLFLAFGALLILAHPDPATAVVAFRYLATGYVAYLIFSLCKFSSSQVHKFSSLFITSCLLSVLFGLWAKYLGGYEVLTHLYSNTISSWVPGQTLPLYHEANGIIRMQGGTSGPVAFGHMMLGALFLMLFKSNNSSPLKRGTQGVLVTQLLSYSVLLIGIHQSYSRAALLAAILLILIKLWTQIRWQWNQKTSFSLATLIILCGLLLFTPQVQFHLKFLVNRAGTSAHFTRPLEAIQDGLQHPITGNLASYGPAARAKNLKENNDDSAPIAENVLADTFVQTGLIGLALILGFWITLWRVSSFESRLWIFTILLTTSLATLFDMIPLAIVYFWVLSRED